MNLSVCIVLWRLFAVGIILPGENFYWFRLDFFFWCLGYFLKEVGFYVLYLLHQSMRLLHFWREVLQQGYSFTKDELCKYIVKFWLQHGLNLMAQTSYCFDDFTKQCFESLLKLFINNSLTKLFVKYRYPSPCLFVFTFSRC